jgi:hexosaminidase
MKKISRKVFMIMAICLLGSLVAGLMVSAAPTGGVAYWNLNEGTGTTAGDSWGTNPGTLTGTTWVAGKYGNGLSFNGTSSYVSVNKADVAVPWTAAMWVNRTDSTAVSAALMSSTNGALKLEQYNNTNKVGFTKYGTADYAFNYTAPTATWVHLTFVGTSTGVSLYVNGAFQESNTGVVNCPMTFIGCGKTSNDYLKGSLDEVKVYSRALSVQEILDIYNNVTSTPSPTPATTNTPTPTPPTGPTNTPTPTPTTGPTATPVTGNLALNKTVTASSVESGTSFTANLAVDGNTGTRWSSAYTDPQWIYVDLGQTYTVRSVKLIWETAYGKAYQIQVSSDATNWTNVYSTTAGNGGTEYFDVTATNGRYVRMYGTQRATTYGYSLWEFEVYNTAAPPPPSPVPAMIPRPANYTAGSGNFTLAGNTAIYVQGTSTAETDEIYSNTGLYLASKLNPATGFNLSVVKANNPPSNSIYLTTVAGDPTLGNEGYTLDITATNVTLSGYKPEGLFRGIQTLRQLFPADIEKSTVVTGVPWVIPCSSIRDYPAYGWRGYMLDVARHFFTVADVKRQIDLMAEYKINQFHLHLTDDQGWRIEIKSWPNLAIIGGNTDYSGGPGGYYTQVQFTDIVNYAKARYMTIVPEIDMPGHCSAAIRAYSQLGSSGQLYPRQESTYTFISNVISELAPLTPGSYIHIGGDESSISASDYDYFIGRANDIVAAAGKKMIGWNPVDTTTGIHTDALLQHWSGSYSSAQSKGILIILSPAAKAYFDMKYDSSNTYGQTWAGYVPTNTAYSWDPTNYVTPSQTVGVEAPLWSEYIDSVSKIDFMTYPRLPGLAEVGWTPVGLRSWTEFKTRLKAHGPRMTNLGINWYHDPVVTW